MSGPWPTELRVSPDHRTLTVSFDDGEVVVLPSRLVRAFTPSAAERGHGGSGFEPVTGIPADVALRALTPVGRYAVRIAFSDGHDSGLYTWERLRRIGREGALAD